MWATFLRWYSGVPPRGHESRTRPRGRSVPKPCLQDDARTLLGRLASFNAAVAQPSVESRRRLVTESHTYRVKEDGECDTGFLNRALRIGFIGHLYN